MSDDEAARCDAMLEEAAIIIDAYSKGAAADAKALVSCRMVRRQLGSGEGDAITFPRERRRERWRLSDIRKAGS